MPLSGCELSLLSRVYILLLCSKIKLAPPIQNILLVKEMLDLSFVVLLASCVLLFSTVESDEKTPLHFGYITTITGSFIAGGGIPAVDLALKLINDRNDILQNYTLGYKNVVDSRVRCIYICDRKILTS